MDTYLTVYLSVAVFSFFIGVAIKPSWQKVATKIALGIFIFAALALAYDAYSAYGIKDPGFDFDKFVLPAWFVVYLSFPALFIPIPMLVGINVRRLISRSKTRTK